MKLVLWTDDKGRKHRSFLRDSDPDHLAPLGVPDDPPNLDRLDWDAIKIELHNALVERGLITWQDVQKSQSGISSSVLAVFRRPLIGLYRSDPEDGPGDF